MSVLSAEDPTATPAIEGAPSGEHDGLDQLKAANYFLRVALDQIPDGLLILRAEDAEGLGPRILFHNTPFATLVCGDGLRDRFVTQLVPGEAEARELLHVLQTSRRMGCAEWDGVVKKLFGDGVVRCLWRVRAVTSSHGVLLNYTITIRPHEAVQSPAPAPVARPTEDAVERLHQENLAFSASGMAHDVNNILNIISMRVSDAALTMPPHTEVGALLDEALAAVGRAQSVTTSVLRQAKNLPAKMEPVEMTQLVRENAAMLRRGHAVKIDVHAEPGLLRAMVDASRVGQIVQNLIINGIQAMRGSGRMEIIARNAVFHRQDGALSPGAYVEIIVRDRGEGIPPEVLEKLFNEAVSTKKGGNGIGLMTCHRIVTEHGGDIRVSSFVGTGTEFSIFLPATHRATESIKPAVPEGIIPGEGVILVVDDEELLLSAAVAVLKRCGYRVYAATNGEDAVSFYTRLARNFDPVDAVIMDLNLAGSMSGEETAREIRIFDPRARIIASSGGVFEQMRPEILAQGFCDILPKPYVASTISEVMHRAITGAARSAKAA